MNHRATPRFWLCYAALPNDVQQLADKNFRLLKQNHQHPSLHFKKVGKFWSARVGYDYRALAVKADQELTWVWIGSHQDYNQLISRKQ